MTLSGFYFQLTSTQIICMADAGRLQCPESDNTHPDLGEKAKENKEQTMHLPKVTGGHKENKAGWSRKPLCVVTAELRAGVAIATVEEDRSQHCRGLDCESVACGQSRYRCSTGS